jgi:hypothetical protein
VALLLKYEFHHCYHVKQCWGSRTSPGVSLFAPQDVPGFWLMLTDLAPRFPEGARGSGIAQTPASAIEVECSRRSKPRSRVPQTH